MKKYYFTIISILVLGLTSCSNEETKKQNKAESRLSAQIQASTVTIGNQVWMTRNLNVSIYSDGTPIPQVTDGFAWQNLTTGAWCYYENSTANGATYGKLYNWYAVAGIYDAASLANPALRKKLAPAGWHVPNDAEWTILTTFLGGENVAGGKMKSTGTIQAGTGLWVSPNAEATNSSRFTALPGCYRYPGGGYAATLGYGGGCWTSDDVGTNNWFRYIYSDFGSANRYSINKKTGMSVRCLKD